jgi:hypothetical protein
LAQWEAPSRIPAVCIKLSYLDVNILAASSHTAFAATGKAATPDLPEEDGAKATVGFYRATSFCLPQREAQAGGA